MTTTVSENIRALSRAQKSRAGAPLYSRVVNRPVGRVLAAVAHRLGASPDQVTVLSALCTYTGIALIALVRPTPVGAVATALLRRPAGPAARRRLEGRGVAGPRGRRH